MGRMLTDADIELSNAYVVHEALRLEAICKLSLRDPDAALLQMRSVKYSDLISACHVAALEFIQERQRKQRVLREILDDPYKLRRMLSLMGERTKS